MITPMMPKNIAFRVETMFVAKGNKVGRLKPDAQGIYHGLPMMVLGQPTQQHTYYDPQSVMEQITNPQSRFKKILDQGKCYGEYGHPLFYGMSNSDKITRLTTVDEQRVCHLFTSLYTDKPSSDGSVVLRASIKPTGPYGQYLKEELDDPVLNPAFSVRAYVDSAPGPNGLQYRTVRSMVTFDKVGPSGYASTDKAHALGLESFSGDQHLSYEMTVMQNGNLMIDQIALESFSNSELNEIFGTTHVSKIIQSRTIVETDKSLMERCPGLYAKTVFNDYFKEG